MACERWVGQTVTPDKPWEHGKYKKLPVHDENIRKHIAPCVDNSHLYNEDCLLADPERLIITEGVTDCISLMEHGFPAVSPVTVRIREADWERLLPRLRNVKTVYVCQDNEISRAGLNGAPWGPVYGEILTFDDPVIRLPAIDRREGFHPLSACNAQAGGGPCLYRRVLVPVQVNGTMLPVWLYVVGDRWTGSFKELTGGIWR